MEYLYLGNILVTNTGGLDEKIKIADYGTSTEENPHLNHNTLVGSLCWVAPEVITQKGHNSKVRENSFADIPFLLYIWLTIRLIYGLWEFV
jgi:serine/threonine protein kinase